jgi:hypothetical protein
MLMKPLTTRNRIPILIVNNLVNTPKKIQA